MPTTFSFPIMDYPIMSALRAVALRLSLLAIVSAPLLVTACGKEAAPPAEAIAPASPESGAALRLSREDLALVVESAVAGGVQLSGSLDPATMVVVKAQVDGTLRGLKVDRGSSVTRGQALVTIDSPGLEAQVLSAAATVASAQADLAVADQNLQASQKLAAAGALSDLDLKAAAAQQRAAAARVAAANATATQAKERLSYSMVTAPIAGAVSERAGEEGQAIRVGDPILTLVDPSLLELKGRIGVDDAGGVRVGQRVTFSLDAFPGKTFIGSVARMDPSADPATRQLGVYARLPNTDRRIVAGQFARGRIESTAGTGKVLMVPTAAIRTAPDGSTYLFVVIDSKVVRREVTTGISDEASGMTVVTKGVTKGEQVVSTTASLTDGAAVVLPTTDSSKSN